MAHLASREGLPPSLRRLAWSTFIRRELILWRRAVHKLLWPGPAGWAAEGDQGGAEWARAGLGPRGGGGGVPGDHAIIFGAHQCSVVGMGDK